MTALYQCCTHCAEVHGECPDLADNGGHLLPCEDCFRGARLIGAVAA